MEVASVVIHCKGDVMTLCGDSLGSLDNTPLKNMIIGSGSLAASSDLDLSLDEMQMLLAFVDGDFEHASESMPAELAEMQTKVDFYLDLPHVWWALSRSTEICTDKVATPEQLLEQIKQKNVLRKKKGPLPFVFELAPDAASLLCTATHRGCPPGKLHLDQVGFGHLHSAVQKESEQGKQSVWILPLPDFSTKAGYSLRWETSNSTHPHMHSTHGAMQRDGLGRSRRTGARESKKDDRLANLESRRRM
eukprot:TRINITY_DN99181_c0_g1_i1.p1 TRINITY_DN99181_c0_g1~~TRINITY_DN99181_c0_g1_i1.p1  ORF type:complete len:248 (+),score=39.41 TRINITY_DN99181_c0_g1_i1:76-819(+)